MLLDADLSSLEYKVSAELCQDELMISEIVAGLDIHSANAINLFGDISFRQAAKVLTFRIS